MTAPDQDKPTASIDSSKRILLVDDSSAFLKVTEIFLMRNGFDVKSALGGEDALEILKEWEPAVLLIDVQMPGMSGFEMMGIMQRENLCPNAKWVVVTGRTDPLDESKARNRGALMILHKPYTKEDLLRLLDSICRDA